LNALFAAGWPGRAARDYRAVLRRSLVYVCAYAGKRLIGFANVAWDGGAHAFLLDPMVHPDFRRQGIGKEIVRRCAIESRKADAEWLHVDFEPELHEFYRECGFHPTDAGLIKLSKTKAKS